MICVVSSLTPARRTLMPPLWSGGSCSSLSRATCGGSGTGNCREVTLRWRPVTGGGFPTGSTPPLKTSKGTFGSFKVGGEVWAAAMWPAVACECGINRIHALLGKLKPVWLIESDLGSEFFQRTFAFKILIRVTVLERKREGIEMKRWPGWSVVCSRTRRT